MNGTYTLPRDIAAVRLRRRQEFDDPRHLCLHNHYAQSENELAQVVVVAEPRDVRRRICARAEEVFVAFGQRLDPIPGFDVFGIDAWRTEDLTAHERMELLETVRRAMTGRGWP